MSGADGLKRALDLCLAVPVAVLSLPVQAAVALVVRRYLGAPVLFRQVRPGRGGAPFTLVKFRTMRPAAPGTPVSDDGARLTPVGSWLRAASLDELPTLWNVIRGEMSLVGPRPLLMAYLDRYTPEQARRHHVRPGLTGLAQVSGRNAVDWEERLLLDVWYVDHRTLWLDVQILARTLGLVVSRQGVSAPGAATVSEFMGSSTS